MSRAMQILWIEVDTSQVQPSDTADQTVHNKSDPMVSESAISEEDRRGSLGTTFAGG